MKYIEIGKTGMHIELKLKIQDFLILAVGEV
jgi:hypothetical protein